MVFENASCIQSKVTRRDLGMSCIWMLSQASDIVIAVMHVNVSGEVC
jgi:hypothetical protein